MVRIRWFMTQERALFSVISKFVLLSLVAMMQSLHPHFAEQSYGDLINDSAINFYFNARSIFLNR